VGEGAGLGGTTVDTGGRYRGLAGQTVLFELPRSPLPTAQQQRAGVGCVQGSEGT
jgi:hypothetical protein